MIKLLITLSLASLVVLAVLDAVARTRSSASRPSAKTFTMKPIGTIHKKDKDVWIEIERHFEDGLSGLDGFSHVWAFWWFDRNDKPGKRGILQVHPKGDARNPLTGVFATRAPVRPNLIALTLCRILSVEGNRIRVADIDAFDGTPVVDLKPYIPSIDQATEVTLPKWLQKEEEQ